MSGRSESSFGAPDGERTATVSRDGSRYRIVVRPYSDWRGGGKLRERPALWTSNGVVPRYVFWIDDSTLEILVLEAERADFGSIFARSESGLKVVTRAIPTTEMRTVLGSELLPELTVGSMNGAP